MNTVSGVHRFKVRCLTAVVPLGSIFSLMDLMIVIEETLIVSDVNFVISLSLSIILIWGRIINSHRQVHRAVQIDALLLGA